MGVDTEQFVQNPDKRRNRQNDRCVAVTVARLNFTKGHRFFLRAMAKLRAEGLVECSREGRSMHYRLADPRIRTGGS